MVEFDVRRTADGQLVAFHDPTVDHVPVGRLTRAEMTERLGFAPALLVEVLELTAGRIALDVELKEDGYVDEVVDAVLDHHPHETTVFTSFVDEVVRRVKARGPLRAGLLLGRAHVATFLPVTRARRVRADFVAVHHRLVAAGMLRAAASAGFPALVWTVNDERALARLLADPRVLGVVTDVPGLAVGLLGRRTA
jgi:glycerophosphoryl diester phosphodiesterase